MKSHLPTKDLKVLRKKLPHGSIKKISEDVGLDQSTVSKVLRGDFQNDAVIDAAIAILENRKQLVSNLKNRIKNL